MDQLTTFCLCANDYPRRKSQSESPPEESEIRGHYKKFRSDFENNKVDKKYQVSNDLSAFPLDSHFDADQTQFCHMLLSNTFNFHGYFLHLILVNTNLTSASNSDTIDNGNMK